MHEKETEKEISKHSKKKSPFLVFTMFHPASFPIFPYNISRFSAANDLNFHSFCYFISRFHHFPSTLVKFDSNKVYKRNYYSRESTARHNMENFTAFYYFLIILR